MIHISYCYVMDVASKIIPQLSKQRLAIIPLNTKLPCEIIAHSKSCAPDGAKYANIRRYDRL